MTESNVSESITRIKPSDIVSRVMTRSVKSDGVDRLRAKIERIGFQPVETLREYRGGNRRLMRYCPTCWEQRTKAIAALKKGRPG